MDDLKGNNPEKEKEKKLSSTFDPNTEEIKDEMEALAAVFQQELDKTKVESEAAEPEILIQDLEDISEDPADNEEDSVNLTEDELCDCCGEKRRGTEQNPDSAYCADCEDGLRHYPFEFLNIFFVLAILAVVFYSGYVFADHLPTYIDVQKADALASENKISEALNAYATAANTMVSEGINGELVYQREIQVAFSVGYMEELDSLAENIRSWELNLPHFRKTKAALTEAKNILYTAQTAYTILNEYDTENTANLPFDEIIGRLTALETAAVEQTTAAEGATAAAVQPTQYSKAMLDFYKYYIALLCNKDNEIQIGYLEQGWKENPEYVWLYGSMLGNLYAKTGRDVTEIARLIREKTMDDASADLLVIIANRIKGDYDGAIAQCEALAAERRSEDIIYELYRQEALCYLAKGDYASAYTKASEAYSNYAYSVEVIDTLALCAAVQGNEDVYNEMSKILTDNGFEIAEDVRNYKAGSITLDDILLKGDYDVE